MTKTSISATGTLSLWYATGEKENGKEILSAKRDSL
jgi:hypothetical protein